MKSSNFLLSQDLSKRYSHLRRTRGDGNCFYRAFSFAYMEKMLSDHSDIPRSVSLPFHAGVVTSSVSPIATYRLKEKMVELKGKIAASNPGCDYDEFHDVVSIIDRILSGWVKSWWNHSIVQWVSNLCC